MGLIVLLAVAVITAVLSHFSPRAENELNEALLSSDYRIQREISIARDRQEWAS
jgi:hypothetical protein